MLSSPSRSKDITHTDISQYPDVYGGQIYTLVHAELNRLGWPEKGISDVEYQIRYNAGTLSKQGPGIMYRRIMIILRKYDKELNKRFMLYELEQRIPQWIQQLHANPQSRIPIVLDEVRSSTFRLLLNKLI